MNKKMIIAAVISIGMMASSVSAGETEPDTVQTGVSNHVTTEMTDGVLTIRIDSAEKKDADSGFYWTTWRGDKGDSSAVEVITETDMEEGLAYAGSFRAIDNGDDTIRLVYTNGQYVKEYLDFNVLAEDGEIREITGGGQAFETKGEDLAPYLEGTWEETEGGTHFMEISLSDDGGLSFTISNSGGRDGNTVFYTMTAYYDAIREALVYWDGVEHQAAITDNETDTEAQEAAGEGGAGVFGIEMLPEDDAASDEPPALGITWLDNSFGNDDTNMFVKAEY